ncbi:MAG: pyridoxamine 5'-phosphate oxidase [Bacteroidales bacterium]
MTNSRNFSEKTIDTNPFVQFKAWYNEHLTFGIAIPDAVTLATASADGKVSARTVLLKDYNEAGFVFYTNYKSRKASQLLSNPRAALLFYWPESGRQIRIEGLTEKISEKDSESYFKKRQRESCLSAWASEQSSVIPDRQYLEKRYDFYKNIFTEKYVARPPHWGGFRLIPEWFEFWQEGRFRLHDRLTYTKRKNLWIIERLSP